CDDLARVFQLDRHDLACRNAVENYCAALAQAARGTVEDKAQRTLVSDAADLLIREYAGETGGDERKHRGSDNKIGCALGHTEPFTESRRTLFAGSGS